MNLNFRTLEWAELIFLENQSSEKKSFFEQKFKDPSESSDAQ